MKKNKLSGPLSAIAAAGLLVTPAAQAALVGHWAFDEGTGMNASDSSGVGNDGAISNATWGSDATRASYLTFNGTSSVVDPTMSLPVMTSTQDFTWAFWVNSGAAATGSQSNAIIVGNRKDGNNADFAPREFIKLTPRQFEWHQNGGSAGDNDYADLPVGVWEHHAVVKTGSSTQYYLNGVATGSAVALTSPGTQAMPFFIGGETNNTSVNEYFQGGIDDVRIYDNALTSGEVLALVVPEPSSAALAFLGLGLLARRRR